MFRNFYILDLDLIISYSDKGENIFLEKVYCFKFFNKLEKMQLYTQLFIYSKASFSEDENVQKYRQVLFNLCSTMVLVKC